MNAKYVDGWTALHIACKHSKADAADLLLRWGADETAVTNKDERSQLRNTEHRRSARRRPPEA